MDKSHPLDGNSSLSDPPIEASYLLTPSPLPPVTDITPVAPVDPQEPSIHLESEECKICECELEVDRVVALGRCDHVFCEQCFRDYLAFRLSERKIKDVTCPAFNCPVRLNETELRRYLDPGDYEKYQRFLREIELEKNPDLRWCPKIDCSGYDCGGVDKRKLICCTCGFTYCFYCLEAWHQAGKCKAEGDRKLDHWAKTHRAKFCPTCRTRIEKQLGCNHMTCVRCHYEFCWLCGETFNVAHIQMCPVTKLKKRNPPWFICLGVLLLPVLLPFAFVILTIYLIGKFLQENEPGGCFYNFLKTWWVSYPLLILLALILTPLVFTLVILFILGAVMIQWGRYVKYDSSSCLNCLARRVYLWNSLSLVLGMLFCWLVVLAVAAVVVLGPPVGLALFIFKAVIVGVRCCCMPDFMRPKGVPGYPVG